MAVVSNGTTIIDAGALGSGVATGKMILIKTLTASNSSTLSFVDGASSVVFDDTYDSYVFKFINIHADTDTANWSFNFRDGATAYDATKTTSYFRAYHAEDNGTAFSYKSDKDIHQGTGFQELGFSLHSDADTSSNGELTIFNPSSTTFVKHFIARASNGHSAPEVHDTFVAGYCNVTAAIDGVQFKMSTGTFDGVIKLYGIGG